MSMIDCKYLVMKCISVCIRDFEYGRCQSPVEKFLLSFVQNTTEKMTVKCYLSDEKICFVVLPVVTMLSNVTVVTEDIITVIAKETEQLNLRMNIS